MSNENEYSYNCLESIAFSREGIILFDRIYKQLSKDQNEICICFAFFDSSI